MFTKKTTLIIPTRNRPNLLKNILIQFIDFKISFYEIIIVDSSNKKNKVN